MVEGSGRVLGGPGRESASSTAGSICSFWSPSRRQHASKALSLSHVGDAVSAPRDQKFFSF